MSKVDKALEKLAYGLGYGGPHDAGYAQLDENPHVGVRNVSPDVKRFLAAQGIPLKAKEKKLKDFYIETSEKEKSPSWRTALKAAPWGTGIGAALGGLLGMDGSGKRPVLKGMGIGGAIGGGLFALLGAIVQAAENHDIDGATDLVESSNMNPRLKAALLEEIGRVEYEKHIERKPWYRS